MAELLSEARDELKAAGRSTEDVNRRRALGSDIRTDSYGTRRKGAPAGVSVVVVGLSHRTVPISVLEPMRLASRPCTAADRRAASRLDSGQGGIAVETRQDEFPHMVPSKQANSK